LLCSVFHSIVGVPTRGGLVSRLLKSRFCWNVTVNDLRESKVQITVALLMTNSWTIRLTHLCQGTNIAKPVKTMIFLTTPAKQCLFTIPLPDDNVGRLVSDRSKDTPKLGTRIMLPTMMITSRRIDCLGNDMLRRTALAKMTNIKKRSKRIAKTKPIRKNSPNSITII